jgi:hypothetical protein
VSVRFGVDPAAVPQFDSKAAPEERARVSALGTRDDEVDDAHRSRAVEELVKLSPRGVPAIAAEPVHHAHRAQAGADGAALRGAEQLARHSPRRPAAAQGSGAVLPRNSAARWEGDTLVVESIGFDERTYIQPNGWFHSDALKVTERYTRPSMNHLIVEITVDDPKVLEKPWKSAPRRGRSAAARSTSSTAPTTRSSRSCRSSRQEQK